MLKLFPIISEKSVELAKKNQFTFEVDKSSTKQRVALEIWRAFKIKPIWVNLISKKAQTKKKMNRFSTKKGLKKAIIKTQPKQIIPGFETFLAEEKDKMDKSKEKQNKPKVKKNG